MKALVTGGGGFLGGAIVRQLLARGDAVRSAARGDYPTLRSLGVETLRGDLSDPAVALRAVSGVDVVFHVAAKAGYWGDYDEYYRANVIATENILAACREHSVTRLVYTSTPSVAYGEGGDVVGADESLPYPAKYDAPYPQTKAIAERVVLGANGTPTTNDEPLWTCALRPHLVWGPGDTSLIPRIVARARAGSLLQIGDGRNVVDTAYIDNAADAHLLAADRLGPGAECAGKAYFISDGQPVNAWEMINRILDAAGLSPVRRRIPAEAAYVAGALIEAAAKARGQQEEPRLTRFVVRNLSTSHWFDISAARRDLGYEPRVSIDEGLAHLRDWYAGQGI